MGMSFKEWLAKKEKVLSEAGFDDSGSDWFFGSYLYPTDAFDWQYAQPYPGDYLFLQSRWKMDREAGRKFINMDIDPIINQHFTTIKSNTMPGEKEEFWTHRPDSRPNLIIDNKAELFLRGYGQRADDIIQKIIGPDQSIKTNELNRMFGKITLKYTLAADDSPWTSNKPGHPPAKEHVPPINNQSTNPPIPVAPLNFKEWMELEQDVTFIQEMFTQGAIEFGVAVVDPEVAQNVENAVSRFFGLIGKVDKWVGLKKFLATLPKAIYAKIMFVFALAKFMKNPLDRGNRENLLHWMSEVGKLSVYSGATIPLAMLVGAAIAPGIGEAIAAGLAKAVSYGYFYMGQWAENMKDHPEHGEFARKILKLLPQTVAHPQPSIPTLAASTLSQNTGEQTPEAPQRPAKSSSFLSRLWPEKRRQATNSGGTTPSSSPSAT